MLIHCLPQLDLKPLGGRNNILSFSFPHHAGPKNQLCS